MFGRGLVWAAGALHKKKRAMIAPSFTHSQLRKSEDAIEALVERMCLRLQDHADGKETNVNIVGWTCKISLDIIGQVGFGYDFHYGEDPAAKTILRFLDEQTRMGMTLPGFVATLVLRSFPWLTEKVFTFTDAQTTVRKVVKERAARIMVKRRQQSGTADEQTHNDLLDALMKQTDMEDDQAVDVMLDEVGNTSFVCTQRS